MKPGTAVIAIGGNSLILDPQRPSVTQQWSEVQETCSHLAGMIASGWNLIVTHGNGPQFGFILRRNELAAMEVHPTPPDLINADTQGSIGYMIQQTLRNELRRRGSDLRAVTLITQVVVDERDTAFDSPSKPIGGFLTPEEAMRVGREGWHVVEEPGRGMRRVIASPKPRRIVESDAIAQLLDDGILVIAAGGGGIPVVEIGDGDLQGVPAVIDKDLVSSLLAIQLDADLLMISTGVEQVGLGFGTEEVEWLDRLTASDARRHIEAGQFPPGSMLPKIEGALDFVEATGRPTIITDPQNLERALDGKTGTWIVPDEVTES